MLLALACGRPDVDQFLDELTPQQLAGWRAGFRLAEKWLIELVDALATRDDLRTGLQTSTLETFWFGEEAVTEPEDFLLNRQRRREQPQRPRTEAERLAAVRAEQNTFAAWATAFNADQQHSEG